MTVLENENRYLNAIFKQLKAHIQMFNHSLLTYDDGGETMEASAITALMDLCESLDIPVEMKMGEVEAMGVYDIYTGEPVRLYSSLKMFEHEEEL